MNITEFEAKLKEHRIRLLKGKQAKQLYQILIAYSCSSKEVQQAIEEYVAPVYRQNLTETASSLFDNLKAIIRQCTDITFMRPKDVAKLMESILGGSQENIERLIKEYGFHQYFTKEFNAGVVRIRDISAKFRQQNLETQFIKLVKRLINELEGQKSQEHKSHITSLQQFREALKRKRIYVKAQCLKDLYHTIELMGYQSQLACEMIKSSTYAAFEKELLQLCKCIDLKYKPIVQSLVPKLIEQFFMDQKQVISLFSYYYEDKQKYEEIMTNYGIYTNCGIQQEDLFAQIKESLDFLMENIPPLLNQKLVISNITEFIKHQYFGNKHQQQGPKEEIKKLEVKSNVRKNPSIILENIIQEDPVKSYYYSVQLQSPNDLIAQAQQNSTKDQYVIVPTILLSQLQSQNNQTSQKKRQCSMQIRNIQPYYEQEQQYPSSQISRISSQQAQHISKNSKLSLKKQDIQKSQEQKYTEQALSLFDKLLKISNRISRQDSNLENCQRSSEYSIVSSYKIENFNAPQINPFQSLREPKKLQPNRITLFLEILSQINIKSQFKILSLVKNAWQPVKDIKKSPAISYKDYFIFFAQCQITEGVEYQLQLQQKVTLNLIKISKKVEKKISIQYQEKDLGYASYSITENPTPPLIRNFSLLTSMINFISFNSTKEKTQNKEVFTISQEKIFSFLYLIYKWFKPLDEKDQQTVFKALSFPQKEFEICSRYFLYFLRSIFEQKAEQKYFKYKLYNKVKFDQSPILLNHEKYPHSAQLQQFYFKMNYYNQLKQQKIKFKGQPLYKLLDINLQIQPADEIYEILARPIRFNGPYRHYSDRDTQIVLILLNNPIVSAVQYFNLRAKYLPFVLQNRRHNNNYQQQDIYYLLLDFLNGLISKCKNDHNINIEEKISQNDVTNLFLKQNKKFRIIPSKYYLILKKMKQLINLSQGTLNLIQPLQKWLKLLPDQQYQFDQLLLVLLSYPSSQFDKKQLKLIFQQRLTTQHLLGFFFKLTIQDTIIEEDLFFEQLQLYFQLHKSKHQEFKYALLIRLSQLTIKNKNKKITIQLLTKIFIVILKLPKSVNYYRTEEKQGFSSSKLKQQFQALFKIENQQFKQLFLANIFANINSFNKQLSLDIFYEVYPDKVNQQKRQYFIGCYLQNNSNDHNFEDLQKLVWNTLKKHPVRILSVKTHLNRIYPAIQQNIITKLVSNDIKSKEIQSILTSLAQNNLMSNNSLKDITEAAEKANNRCEIFRKKIEKMIEVMKPYRQHFGNQLKELQIYQGRIGYVKLSEAFQIDKKYKKIFDKCQDIYNSQPNQTKL